MNQVEVNRRVSKLVDQKRQLRIKHESDMNRIYNLSEKIAELQAENAALKGKLSIYESATPIKDVVFENEGQKVTRAIQQKYPNFGLWCLKTRSRKREICVPRQIWQSIMVLKKFSLKQVGEYCGGRDHSSIINSKQVVQDLCDTDKKFLASYETILKEAK
jgi:chromosomal replication initiator protein